MQDINKRQRERERESNRKHKGFVSRFEHTCSTSLPSTHEGFSLKSIPPDHLVPQHLQALGLPSPYTRKPHKLAEAAPQTNKFAPELETPSPH